MATLREVAKYANVSIATVSKVLSNTPYVSEETRERVQQAIAELGYVPNLAARALSKGRTHNIGVIFPYIIDHLFSDPHILMLVEGIEVVCTENGCNMLISTPRMPISESEQYQTLVRSGYLDGALTIETLPNSLVSEPLEKHGYPWVAIGYNSARGDKNTIHADDFGGAKDVAEHLLSLGHRRFGIITVTATTLAAAEQRLNGYRIALEQAGLNFQDVPVVIGNFSIESGFQAADELLKRDPHPTALLCLNDRMAIGAMERARSDGLRIPGDVSIVGFDDIPTASLVNPPLTTVQQPALDLGREAARRLFEMIDSRARRNSSSAELEFEPIIFPTRLIIRESSGPPA